MSMCVFNEVLVSHLLCGKGAGEWRSGTHPYPPYHGLLGPVRSHLFACFKDEPPLFSGVYLEVALPRLELFDSASRGSFGGRRTPSRWCVPVVVPVTARARRDKD